MKIKFIAAGAAAMLMLFSSCSDKKWTVEGNISGAEGKELILEATNDQGRWYGVDTLTVGTDGDFRFQGEPVGRPEVYRLRLGSESAYFPIDSLETVTLNGKAGSLANGYTLAGSPEAENMQRINHFIDSVSGTPQGFDTNAKRRLTEMILQNPAGISAYYTILRTVGNTPVFNTADQRDVRVIGAVANAFSVQRPDDPRTEWLKELYLNSRQHVGGERTPGQTIVAEEISYPEIDLVDVNGTRRTLSSVAGKGNVVVVNFTAYTAENSPAVNVALAKVYDAYKGRGLEIYQVGCDTDEYLWRQSAKNIPWIAVYNTADNGARTLLRYNVGALPATFIINRNGELVARVDDLTKLESELSKYL